MEHTKNYNLPQWKKDDRIMMDDFNSAMSSIETGLSDNAQAAARAQKTADTLPYVVGSYVGDGAEERTISVGFRPRFVILCQSQSASATSYTGFHTLIAGPTVTSDRLYMTDTGFRLTVGPSTHTLPRVNEWKAPYDYIAFR